MLFLFLFSWLLKDLFSHGVCAVLTSGLGLSAGPEKALKGIVGMDMFLGETAQHVFLTGGNLVVENQACVCGLLHDNRNIDRGI